MNLRKIKNWSFFNNIFGFEKGIDIADDCQVLFRKNIVVKNIIFLSNIIYTFIFAIVSLGESSNWVLTIICFPITYLVNRALKKMIYKNPNDLLKQQIAMYMASFYMFLTAILIYFKLQTGSQNFLEAPGYILLYYSIVVVSLYQDKKMLRVVFQWLLVIVTILHFTVTYNIVGKDYATDLFSFFRYFFISKEFKDILLRTVLLIVFMLVISSIVSMSGYMQEQRKKELIKRRQVQEDFTRVVSEIFEVTLNNSARSNDEVSQVELIALMSRKLASVIGLPPKKCDLIYEQAKVHTNKQVKFNQNELDEDKKFENLREQTNLGSIIIKRLQLERKCEDIIRAHMEGSNDDEFVNRMLDIQHEPESQIIMLCEMYTDLRSIRSYKKAYNHKTTMQYLEEQFRRYYDANIFDRFVRFQDDFEKLYDEF